MRVPRIKVDPVTRIEGHLRVEAQVDGGKVTEAWSSGTMFRGLEQILRGKDPREAWIWAQRICGVCTTVHAIASVRAVENALDIEVPRNAEILRNLIIGSQNVHDHVIHFYHLHALDWVDITSALKADPKKTAQLAQSISDWPQSGPDYFKGVAQRLNRVAESGQLSLLAGAWWGHPAYKLPPEANLMATAHYLQALEWQREVIRVHAVLGGKNPHPQTFVVGGMASPLDLDSPQAINGERINFLRARFKAMRDFVDQVYLPDVLAVAGAYKEWAGYGAGARNYLVYGGMAEKSIDDLDSYLWPRGVILDGDLTTVHDLDPDKITEEVAHAWYEYEDGDRKALHPYRGETKANYTGPKPPYEWLETDRKYSWMKAPRFNGQPMEVGPLARVLVAYASGRKDVQREVDGVLKALDVGPEALFSTLGRVAARALEAKIIVHKLDGWLSELEQNMQGGDLRIADTSKWDPGSWPKKARGWGWHEVPRGSLGHWVEIEDREIAQYQAVVPTTWNGGPRDSRGVPGPYEQSLVGNPVQDPKRPLEVLRTIHSFDPCIACAVHVAEPGRQDGGVRIDLAHGA